MQPGKRKVALIFAYNGAKFSGNQAQQDEAIRTVEPQLEQALFDCGCISADNHKQFQKVRWTRSSRTDKGVHAMSTVVGLRMLFDDRPADQLIADINAKLPEDIRLLSIKPVVQSFNAKTHCSYREYEYLFPYQALFPDQAFEPSVADRLNQITAKFQGTNNFHNYTRKLGPKCPKVKRYVVSFTVSSEPTVFQGTEYIKFQVLGQSFLYHQIRNMIGMSLAVLMGRYTLESIPESFGETSFVVPLAPPYGLMLGKVLFPVYNKKNSAKPVELSEEDHTKIAEFKETSLLPTIHSHFEEFKSWCALEYRSGN